MKNNKLFNLTALLIVLMIPFAFSFDVEVVNTDPAPVIAGDYADITLRIINSYGEDAKENVNIAILASDKIKPLNDEKYIISKLYYKEVLTKTFRVYFDESIEQGTITVPVIITGNNFNEKKDVEIYVQNSKSYPELEIGKLKLVPNELLADTKNNKLQITVFNLGDKDAQLLSATLVPLTDKIVSSYGYSFSDSLSEIKSGAEGTFSFDLDTKENISGNVEAKLILKYRAEKSSANNNYRSFEKELNFTIPITDSPYLVVESVEELDKFTVGSTENRIRIKVKNIGNEDATDVRLRIVPDSSYPFSFEQTTQYVSSKIKVNESSYVEFKLEVFDYAQVKNYSNKILLESMISDSRYSQEDEVYINVNEKEGNSNVQNGIYLLIVVLGVSIILGFIKYVDSKKLKKK